jgi:hypothetical protein
MSVASAIKAYEALRDERASMSENAKIALAAAAILAPSDRGFDGICDWVRMSVDVSSPMPLCALSVEK